MKHASTRYLLFALALTVAAGAAVITFQTLRAAQAPPTAAQPVPTTFANVPGNQWAPQRAAAATADAISSEEAIRTFSLPPGYRAELVAAEPLVDSPILIDFDADGRMWVVEMPAFLPDLSGRDSFDPLNRVVVLEDTNDDGEMDKRTVFVDKLVMPRAIKVLDKGVLIAENPRLWYMRDTDGDLKADTRELVTDTYGRGGNVEHDANSLMWAMDNVMYSSEHASDLRLKNGAFEILPGLSRGQWLITQDDVGRVYRNVNDAPLFIDYTPSRYFLRNPNVPRTRGLYEPLIEQIDATVYPVRATRGVNRGYRDEWFRRDGSSIVIQGTSGPTIYRGDKYPESMRGTVFIADSPTNLVHQMTLVDDGTGRLSAKNTWDRGEFFASSDERSRPVTTYSAPDGNLYVVDMYRGVVQAGGLWSDYLTQYIRKNNLLLPVGYGRIWRVVYGNGPNTRGPKPQLSRATPAQLVQTLSHPNGWWRDMAQQLLIQRGDKSIANSLVTLAASAPDRRTRLHALWTLEGLDEITPAVVTKALGDQSADVRAAAVKIAERWLPMPGHAVTPAVLRLSGDASFTVRRQVAASIGALPAEARIAPAVAVINRDGNDPIVVDALVSGLGGLESRVLQQATRSASAQAGPVEALEILAAAVVKSGDAVQVQLAVDTATDAQRPAWVRRAILEGLTAALPAPAVAGRGQPVRLPGLSEPGSRFAQVTAGRGISLPAEPSELTRMASATGPDAALATELAARLNWTGKPAPPPEPPVVPLTAEEQTRFDSGKTLYTRTCAGCHGAEGEGRDKVGANLVTSRYVVAAPAVSIRILTNGKEGPIGLMPPVRLTDDQMADVLTYMRRAWGHTASAVTPREVRENRQSSVKTGVWTEEELAAMLAPRGGRGGRGGQQPAGRGGQQP